jgi:hypothetical protein
MSDRLKPELRTSHDRARAPVTVGTSLRRAWFADAARLQAVAEASATQNTNDRLKPELRTSNDAPAHP